MLEPRGTDPSEELRITLEEGLTKHRGVAKVGVATELLNGFHEIGMIEAGVRIVVLGET